MSWGFDETALADVATLAEGRRLGDEARDRLARALAGDVAGDNRDLPVWNAAHLMLALTAFAASDPAGRRNPVDALIGYVLDPALASPSGARRRFAGSGARGAVKASGGEAGLILDAGEASRTIAWSQAALSLALIEFIATADDCQRFGEVRAALDALCAAGPEPIDSAREATRRLGRLLADWRRAHFDGAEIDQEQRELLRYLERAGKGFHLDDEALLAYWRERVTRGARLTFRAAVRHAMIVESRAAERAARGAFAAPASVEDAIDLAGGERPDATLLALEAETASGADNDDGPPSDGEEDAATPAALRALNRVPTAPKMLLSAERADLGQAFEIAPWHLTRPMTTLRYAALGDVQAVLVEALRKRTIIAIEAAFDGASDYEALRARWAALAAHLARLDETARAADALPASAAEFAKLAAGFRRAGFDQPADDLARAFRKSGPDLAMIALQARKFLEAIDRLQRSTPLAERYDRDKEAFSHAFRQQYSPAAGVKP